MYEVSKASYAYAACVTTFVVAQKFFRGSRRNYLLGLIVVVQHAHAGSVPIVDHCHNDVINGERSRRIGGLCIHVVFLIGTVFVQDQVFSDIMECISRNVDKLEISFHMPRHSFGEAGQFFSDVFFESCPSPTAHLLYLGVRVAGDG